MYRHPRAQQIAELQAITDEDAEPAAQICSNDAVDDGARIVNSWSGRLRDVTGEVYVIRSGDGRTRLGFQPDLPRRNRMLFGPFDTLDAWHLDTELTAMERLSTLLTPRMFGAYVMTGMFLETSKRSGLTYLFRRLRPTIVLSPHGARSDYFKPETKDDGDGMRILCCLCLHPLAYYAGSFCGAMVPTDDVIAHLLLMRGDEAMFWRRANHHAPHTVESGL